MGLIMWQVDAFADEPFTGNPAGVTVLDQPADPVWMQKAALEMNLSETAFLVPAEDGYDLRWFTPAVEVDLCGHATLASAHILWSEGFLASSETARFHTRSGLLQARLLDGGWIEMDFPATPAQECEPPAGLLEALGLDKALFVGQSRFDYLVEAGSEELVRNLKPDLTALKKVEARGIIVTARAETAGLDFVSRFFAPAAGVDEDPVTGSAHSCLAPYWEKRLGRSSFDAYQASARGGFLKVKAVGDRVLIAGRAVTVFKADFLASPK